MDAIDINCYRGDTAEWTLIAREDAVEIDLTGGQVIMAARRNPASPVLFERTSATGGGITIGDQVAATGSAVIKLKPEDTLQLSNEKHTLFYTIHVITAGGDQWLVAHGKLEVGPIAWDGTP